MSLRSYCSSAIFFRDCEFNEPTDAHLQVYSHRLYEILLRACTEFESLCREILMTHGLRKKGNLNIFGYVEIAPSFGPSTTDIHCPILATGAGVNDAL